jgi:hypothetical protein
MARNLSIFSSHSKYITWNGRRPLHVYHAFSTISLPFITYYLGERAIECHYTISYKGKDLTEQWTTDTHTPYNPPNGSYTIPPDGTSDIPFYPLVIASGLLKIVQDIDRNITNLIVTLPSERYLSHLSTCPSYGIAEILKKIYAILEHNIIYMDVDCTRQPAQRRHRNV